MPPVRRRRGSADGHYLGDVGLVETDSRFRDRPLEEERCLGRLPSQNAETVRHPALSRRSHLPGAAAAEVLGRGRQPPSVFLPARFLGSLSS